MVSSKPTFLSLFCGCGGFDEGFARAGFVCNGAFDIDTAAITAHRANFGDIAERKDISAPNFDWSQFAGTNVLVAGPPCQGFSTVGRRVPEDPRNHLLRTVAEVAKKVEPSVVIVENVTGVTAGSIRYHWDALSESLRNSGYSTRTEMFDASFFGVPQRRRRVVLFGWHGFGSFQLPRRSHNVIPLRPALEGVEGLPDHLPRLLPRGSAELAIARRIKAGQKLCNVRAGERSVHTWHIPAVFGQTTAIERKVLEALLRLRRRQRTRDHGDADPVTGRRLALHLAMPVMPILSSLLKKGYVRKVSGAYDLANTFNGKYRRLSLDAPAPTVDTRFGQPRYYLHPTEHRPFTVRETARIQGFPDSFTFTGSDHTKFRLIGNAVPPPLAARLADSARSLIALHHRT